jgi:hypothetical protein
MTLCGAQINAPELLARDHAYDTERASAYHRHHRKNLRTRISTARERQLVGRARDVRQTDAVLDPRAAPDDSAGDRDALSSIVAVDNSDAMLREAVAHAEPHAHRPPCADRRSRCRSAIARST